MGAQPLGAGVITLEMSFKRQRDIENEQASIKSRLERSKQHAEASASSAASASASVKFEASTENELKQSTAVLSSSKFSNSPAVPAATVAIGEHAKVLAEKGDLEQRLRKLEEQHAALKKQAEAALSEKPTATLSSTSTSTSISGTVQPQAQAVGQPVPVPVSLSLAVPQSHGQPTPSALTVVSVR